MWSISRPRVPSRTEVRAGYNKNIWTEIEQYLAPQGYRPDPGDRENVVGRWIVDGGHDDFHSELHPTEAMVSTFLQTGHGNPATVTKFVVTSDWQGEDLTFDVYPPARPSTDAKLHWAKENGITLGQGVTVSYSLEPADNPNHLVVNVHGANACMLWWESNP
jgi:hypothetical protein